MIASGLKDKGTLWIITVISFSHSRLTINTYWIIRDFRRICVCVGGWGGVSEGVSGSWPGLWYHSQDTSHEGKRGGVPCVGLTGWRQVCLAAFVISWGGRGIEMATSLSVRQRKQDERSMCAGLRDWTFSSGAGAKEKKIHREPMVMTTMMGTSPCKFPRSSWKTT